MIKDMQRRKTRLVLHSQRRDYGPDNSRCTFSIPDVDLASTGQIEKVELQAERFHVQQEASDTMETVALQMTNVGQPYTWDTLTRGRSSVVACSGNPYAYTGTGSYTTTDDKLGPIELGANTIFNKSLDFQLCQVASVHRIDGTNNVLYVTEDYDDNTNNTDRNIVVPFGEYLSTDLAATLKSLLNTGTSYSSSIYDVTYTASTNLFQITASSKTTRFSWQHMTNLAIVLGIAATATSLTSSAPINSTTAPATIAAYSPLNRIWFAVLTLVFHYR